MPSAQANSTRADTINGLTAIDNLLTRGSGAGGTAPLEAGGLQSGGQSGGMMPPAKGIGGCGC